MTAMLKAAGKTPADYEMPEENMEKMKQDMAKLEAASGAKFDQVFLTQMIHHHHGALAMTALVPDRSRKQEVKQMAEKMTADQKNEIEKMEKMIAVALALLVLWGLHPATASSTALNGIWCLVILFPLWIAGAWLMTNWARVRDFVSFRLWLLGLLLSLVSMGLLAIARYHVLSPNITYALGLPALPGWLLIVAGGRHLQLGARIEWRPLWRWLGLLSFPCYILHYPILSFIHHWLGPDRSLVALQNPWLRSLILLAPTFVLVALVGPPLERRLLAWRARGIQSNNSVPAQAQSIPGDVP